MSDIADRSDTVPPASDAPLVPSPHDVRSRSTKPEYATSIIIASDVRLYCVGLRSVLGALPDIAVLGIATDGPSAVAAVGNHRPDVLLIDMAMESSLRVVRTIRVETACPVVALALPETEGSFLPCAEAGIQAFVGRDAECEELVRTIHAAHRGEARIPPSLAGSLLRRVSTLADTARRPRARFRLTPREHEVAALMSEGLSNKKIASELQIGLATVKNHVHNVLKKMNLSRRSQVAATYRKVREDEDRWAAGRSRSWYSDERPRASPRV